MKRFVLATLVLPVLCFCLFGCQSTNSSIPNNTYNMNYGLDAMQYRLFLNKQSTTVLNQLSTHMILALRVTDATKESTLESAKSSLEAIKAVRHEVDIMFPPANYTETRTSVLRLYDSAISDMENMILALESTPVDADALSALVEQMQNDFVALTAEFDVY